MSKQIIHICSGQIAVVLFHTILVADFWGSTGRNQSLRSIVLFAVNNVDKRS